MQKDWDLTTICVDLHNYVRGSKIKNLHKSVNCLRIYWHSRLHFVCVSVCLSIYPVFLNSWRRLPETKRHSSLFLHWSGSKFLVVMAPIGRLPRWRIVECSPDRVGTGEIKYPGWTKTSTAARQFDTDLRRYFKKFPHFFVCRVLVSVRLLRVGSIVHHILIVWPWLWLVPILSVWVAIER